MGLSSRFVVICSTLTPPCAHTRVLLSDVATTFFYRLKPPFQLSTVLPDSASIYGRVPNESEPRR